MNTFKPDAWALSLAGAAILVAGSAAIAQTSSEPQSPPSSAAVIDADSAVENSRDLAAAADPLRVEFNSWFWMMAIDGDLGVGNREANIDASFGDILDASDSILAFSGRLELGYGRIAGYVDALYADLGADNESGRAGIASIDVEFEQTIIDFGLMYRLGDWEPAGAAASNPRNITLDLYGGGRYVNLDVKLSPDVLASRSASDDWVDPIIGAKLVVPLAERWHIALNGDVGGFGVESDFTWSATAVVGYSFHLFDIPSSVLLGYRAIGWDYSEGGDNGLSLDLIQHGIILGFSMSF